MLASLCVGKWEVKAVIISSRKLGPSFGRKVLLIDRTKSYGHRCGEKPCSSSRRKPVAIVAWLKCCVTSTETVVLLGTGAQGGHLDFHTAPELCNCCGQKHVDIVTAKSVTTGVVKSCNACRHIWLHKGQFEFEFDCHHDRQTSLITVSGIETAAASFPSLTEERTKQATLHWKPWHVDPTLFESMHGPTGSTAILAGKRINGGPRAKPLAPVNRGVHRHKSAQTPSIGLRHPSSGKCRKAMLGV